MMTDYGRARPLVLCAVLCMVATAGSCDALSQADAIVGEWITGGRKSKVQIFKCGEEYCGKIIWLRDPEKDGKPVHDDKNPDVHRRTDPVLGLTIMHGFSYDEDNVWKGGNIYDPESGNDYRAKITLVDDTTMALRGYLVLPLFGRTETWTRP